MADLAVIILTYNEALHIERAIRSVQGFAQRVVVVDSFSTDDTAAKAQACGALVLQNAGNNHGALFHWGVEMAALDTAWIMRLDADEIIEPDLAAQIERVLPGLSDDVTGVILNRKHVFMGRFIKHGGRYPMYLLRIWRRGRATVEQRWMDEHVRLHSGRTIVLRGGFADVNIKDLTAFIQKHNAYATREAFEIMSSSMIGDNEIATGDIPLQAIMKRKLKQEVYGRLGFGAPFIYFLYRYIVRLGFLDGVEGLIYHILQGFWFRFLVASKVLELRRALAGIEGSERRLEELTRLTGFTVRPRSGA